MAGSCEVCLQDDWESTFLKAMTMIGNTFIINLQKPK